jgi:tRNA A37 threonylcarbamoyladenosine dehydratase
VVLGIEEVYPHCPEVLLRSGAWNPELTIADIEQVEVDSLDYRYE